MKFGDARVHIFAGTREALILIRSTGELASVPEGLRPSPCSLQEARWSIVPQMRKGAPRLLRRRVAWALVARYGSWRWCRGRAAERPSLQAEGRALFDAPIWRGAAPPRPGERFPDRGGEPAYWMRAM